VISEIRLKKQGMFPWNVPFFIGWIGGDRLFFTCDTAVVSVAQRNSISRIDPIAEEEMDRHPLR
jgi:hypothetical protein